MIYRNIFVDVKKIYIRFRHLGLNTDRALDYKMISHLSRRCLVNLYPEYLLQV
jgi:hypothetical protein